VRGEDAGQYQVEVSNASGTVWSEPVVVEVALRPVVTLPERVVAMAGETVSLLGESRGGGAVEYAWYRERNGQRVVMAGEGYESLVLPFVGAGDAGRYVLTAQNAAGRGEAVVEVEVTLGGEGSGEGAGSGTGSGGEGGTGVGMERWWVFEEVSSANGAGTEEERGLVWVYDRVGQQSAWVWRETGGEWRWSEWAMEDQQVVQVQRGGGGERGGAVSFEVEGARPGGKEAGFWDGYELSGQVGVEGMPEVLTGRYGARGDGERRPITLKWSGAKAQGVLGAADLQGVILWLRTGGGE
jgi:hypothetical protein